MKSKKLLLPCVCLLALLSLACQENTSTPQANTGSTASPATAETIPSSPSPQASTNDLKLINPKPGSRTSAQELELRWEPYTGASDYTFSVYPEDATARSPYVNKRVDSPSFKVDQLIPGGTYLVQIQAFNDKNEKLAEGLPHLRFIVIDTVLP